MPQPPDVTPVLHGPVLLHRRVFLRSFPGAVAAVLAACDRDPIGPRLAPPVRPPPPLGPDFLFATGIENSYPLLPDGRRVDEMDRTGHSVRWREDFGLARELGVTALRYGPAYYRVHAAPDRYDWSTADEPMAWLRESGITVIADLCHFGVPPWLGGFNDPAFPAAFAGYAAAFARRYPWVRHYTPVNEIFIAAKFSAMLGWWNESLTGERAFARTLRMLCLAHERAVEALVAARPDAVIVQAESMERYEPADASAGAARQAAFWNEARFVALDLTLGRPLSPAGAELLASGGLTAGEAAFFRARRAAGRRWLGVDYYATGEQTIDGQGRAVPTARRAGLAALAGTYHGRYGLPLCITETNHVDAGAVAWLGEQWAAVGVLRRAGVPVTGFTWYPLVDVVDWRHALRLDRGDVDPIGLCDLGRNVRAAGRAYAALIAAEQRIVASGRLVAARVG